MGSEMCIRDSPCVHCKRAWFDHYEEEKMTEKDMLIEDLRRKVSMLEGEVEYLKAMQRRMVKYVPTEALGQMALELMPKKRRIEEKSLWED